MVKKESSLKATTDDEGDERGSAQTVSALKRGLDIPRCIEHAGGSLSLQEIARRCGLPKATTLRLLGTHEACGFVRRSRTSGNYLLGSAVIGLSRVFLQQMDLRSTARPLLTALSERLGGTAVLALREGGSMVVIEAHVPETAVAVARVGIGWHAPVATSCMGLAYFSALSAAERQQLLARLSAENPDRWIDPRKAVERALGEVAQYGYCTLQGHTMPGINSASTAFLAPDGEVLVLACFAPEFSFSEQRLHSDVGPQLVHVAREIAAEIGGAAPRSSSVVNMEFISTEKRRRQQ